jgi:hypothetical protein
VNAIPSGVSRSAGAGIPAVAAKKQINAITKNTIGKVGIKTMLTRIVSGGQTGVDQAGLYAAQILGIATGGWAPQGWMTERGPMRELLESFGLAECARAGYPARTEQNVRDSTATLIISHEKKLTGGSYDTLCVAESLDRPCYQVWLLEDGKWDYLLKSGSRMPFKTWLGLWDVKVLNVAGPRASKCKWIEEGACQWLLNNL